MAGTKDPVGRSRLPGVPGVIDEDGIAALGWISNEKVGYYQLTIQHIRNKFSLLFRKRSVIHVTVLDSRLVSYPCLSVEERQTQNLRLADR